MPPRPEVSESKVIEAATELFLAEGLTGVTVEDIALRAGVARRTVFNRFGSKEAIFDAVLDRHWARYDSALDTLGIPDDAMDVAEALRRIGQSIVEFNLTTRQADFARLVIAEGGRQPELVGKVFGRGRGRALEAFEAWLARMVDEGRLGPLDPALAALQFLGLIQEPLVWPLVTRTPVPGIEPDRVVDGAVELFLARYGAPPSGDRRRSAPATKRRRAMTDHTASTTPNGHAPDANP